MTTDRKPLYQPWNEDEFRSDVQVGAMTPIERWMYRTLLQNAFFYSTRPYLPDDDGQLWMLAGCENRKQWDKHKGAVSAMFTPVEIDGIRLLSRKRLLADWNRLQEKRQILAENGRKGRKAQLQSSDCLSNAEQLPGICPPNAEQGKLKEVKGSEGRNTNACANENSSHDGFSKSLPEKAKTKRVPVKSLVPGFEEFWTSYPYRVDTKGGKQDAQTAWSKLKDTDVPLVMASLARHKQTHQWLRDGGAFVPNASTFLNGRRWKDEISTPTQPSFLSSQVVTARDINPRRPA